MGGVVLAIPHRVPLGPLSVAGFVLIAVVVGALTARRPAFGAVALLVLDPFAWAHDIGPTQITLGKAALIGAVVALIARRSSLAALWAPRARPLAGGALAIVAISALTAIPGTYLDAVARETLKAAEYVLAFATAAVAISQTQPESEDAISAAVLATTFLACVLALVQEVSGAPSGVIVGSHIIPRIAGPLDGPNQLAGFIDLAIPFALVGALEHGTGRFVARVVFARVVFGLAFITLVLTLSRAGVIGALVGIVCVLAFRSRRTMPSWRSIVSGLAGVVALASVANGFGFARRFFDVGEVSRENGLGTRAQLWRAAIELWKSDPALGIGAGNYELVLPRAGLIGVRTHANSLYLQSLAEGGIALASAVVWTIVAAVALCFRGPDRSRTLVAIGSGTIALAVHQIFDDLTFFPKVGEFWWLLLGVAVGLSFRAVDRRKTA